MSTRNNANYRFAKLSSRAKRTEKAVIPIATAGRMPDKIRESEELKTQIDEFLKSGGRITRVESKSRRNRK